MPTGVTILTDKIQMSDTCPPLILFAAIAFIAAFVGMCGLISDVYRYRNRHNRVRIVSIIALFMVCAGLVFGIYCLANTTEHEYKVTISDEISANWLYENFKVRKVDGLIYTIIPKEDKWT